MIINLDKSFKPLPFKEEIIHEKFIFPGGEPHIKIHTSINPFNQVTITHRIKSFNDIGLVLITVNALRNLGVKELHLVIPYFPGARQDRLMVKGEPLTVRVYTDIINSLDFESVTIFDPHSDVTPALLNKHIIINNHRFIEQVTAQLPNDLLLISPDAGAYKKIFDVAKYLKNYEVIQGTKNRNIQTGKLTDFNVFTDDLQSKDCLIIDDICDGGGTFLGLADVLKSKNAGNLYLAVSHGIFSKGLDELSKKFHTIFTTNSFNDISHKSIVQIGMHTLM